MSLEMVGRVGSLDPWDGVDWIRLQKETPHPIGGENVKTICRRDMKALLGHA